MGAERGCLMPRRQLHYRETLILARLSSSDDGLAHLRSEYGAHAICGKGRAWSLSGVADREPCPDCEERVRQHERSQEWQVGA